MGKVTLVNGEEVIDKDGRALSAFGPSEARCPAGTTLVGGGTHVTPTPPAAAALLASYPVSGEVWIGEGVRLADGGTVSLVAWALCAEG